MASSDLPLTALTLILAALALSILVIAQTTTSYTSAYLSAPLELPTFLDAADFSIQENESYDRDIARVPRLEDKIRLNRLLREIQKCGDDLREDLNRLLIGESGTRLRASARLLWASNRLQLEQRVRRLDLLRTRFLVLYMGLLAQGSVVPDKPVVEKSPERSVPKMALRPHLHHALTEGIVRKPPLRRLTTQAMGHSNTQIGGAQKMGWASVVNELQMSPLMHKRHASIDAAMANPP
ncbi:hypothetical protein VE02_05671 [Pseudogymnoascus sp. 03VT05]|nr:hypothetical protein VE02_05671 [Pseudogymnoascus sp. 03VT05]